MLFLLRGMLLLCEGLCYIKGDDEITLEKKKEEGKRERERKQQGLAVVER